MNSLAYISIGALLGCVIGWLFRALRTPPIDTRVEDELRKQVSDREMQLGQLRGELTSAREARATAEAARAAAEKNLQEQRAEFEKERASDAENQAIMTAELKRLGQLHAAAEAEKTFLNERLTTERKQIETVQEKFRKEFEAISNQLLLNSSNRFKEQSAERLNELLTPLKSTLTEVKSSLESTRKETETHSALLKDQIGRIGTEAANLSKALKGDVKVLGNWGENMLDKLLELSGLKQDVHYRRQVSVRDKENGARIIDVIVDLADGRNIIIDSKVSLNRYEQWINCTNETEKAAHLSNHIAAIRRHFETLGEKSYHDCVGVNAPDWVLMYIPIEGAFSAAISEDYSVFNEALNRKVILVTNSSLLAALRTVHHVWSIRQQEQNALRIAEAGGKLYDKFVGFVADMEAIGKALRNGTVAYDDALKKLQTGRGNLLSQAQQLCDLGAKAKKALPVHLVENADDDGADPESLEIMQTPRLASGGQLPLPTSAVTGF
jgi:DNA recombination protein RmuC